MSNNTMTSIAVVAASLGVLRAATAMAQSSSPATTQDGVSVHHQRLYKVMNDMTQEMSGMTEQMWRGALAPDQRKQGPSNGIDVGLDAPHVGL